MEDNSTNNTEAGTMEPGDKPSQVEAAVAAFSLKDLEAEVAALKASPLPPYIGEVGDLYRPSAVTDENGELAKADPEIGPFDLEATVRGKEGDEAYGYFFRVTLRFDADLWPDKLAIVRFRGVFHHALTDEHNNMTMPFYRSMKRDSKKRCTIALVLESIHDFLVDPLAMWNVDLLIAPERAMKLQKAVEVHRGINQDRMDIIMKYRKQALHKELFERPACWKEEWLDPGFLKAYRSNCEQTWRSILVEHLKGEVFSLPIFTEKFCKLLLDEIFNFYDSGLPARRPNSMNAYGIILNDMGLEPMIDELQKMLQPLGELLFGAPGTAWDGHHCFIVRYRAGEDLGLDMHTDDSDVTCNICLGLDFTGAGLQFCGIMGAPNHRKHTYTFQHRKGWAVIHLGRKRHGADDISSGERLNLILWNHSSAYRQTDAAAEPEYNAEEGPPDAVCVSYTHDRDYGNFKEYPPGKEHFRGRGWCPRRSYEYEGFEMDCEQEQPECCSCGRPH